MDDLAKQDFQTISSSMATTGVNIHFLSATYDRSHVICSSVFLTFSCNSEFRRVNFRNDRSNLGVEISFLMLIIHRSDRLADS
jgi:hypothetical protein